MGLFRSNICPKCGEEYSAFRSTCPKCGARKQSKSYRSSAQSDTARRGSPEQQRSEADTRWQMLFGLCLVAAVIIAVIILIVTTINGGYETYPKPSPSQAVVSEEPSPSPSPLPSPSPTPHVESIVITYAGETKTGFTMSMQDAPLTLKASIYPIEIEGEIAWSSSNEAVFKVDANGTVTPVGVGTATLYAKCYDGVAECQVVIKQSW